MDYSQQCVLSWIRPWIRRLTLNLSFVLLLPTLGSAIDFDIVGGSQPEKRLVSCIAEAAMPLLREVPSVQQTMTFVILEHNTFMQSRGAFHAYRTKFAYSNLSMQRVYLSSRVLADLDTALWVVGHELGHFMIRDGIEDHAEFAARRIRWRAHQRCGAIP